MSEALERARVCAVARTWIGTPYHDCGEIKGVGVDCAKLLAMTYWEALLIERQIIPDYSPQWFLHQTEERFLNWVKGLAEREIAESEVKPGDIVLYKLGLCYAHGAIVLEGGWPNEIIHAWFNARLVRRSHGLEGQLGRPKHVRRYFSWWG